MSATNCRVAPCPFHAADYPKVEPEAIAAAKRELLFHGWHEPPRDNAGLAHALAAARDSSREKKGERLHSGMLAETMRRVRNWRSAR